MHLTTRADRTLRLVGAAVGVTVFVVLVGYVTKMLADGQLQPERLRIGPLLGAFGLFICASLVQATAWHALLRGGFDGATWAMDASRWAMSLVGKYVPGKVFHGVSRWYLYREGPTGGGRLAATYVVEAVIGISAAAGVAAVAFFATATELPPDVEMTFVLLAFGGVVASLTHVLDRTVGGIVQRMAGAAAPPAPVRYRVVPYLLALAAYVMLGAGMFVLTLALGPLPIHLAPFFAGALCAAGIAGIAAFFVPAGIGIRDGALAWLLSFVVPLPLAALIAVGTRAWLVIGDATAIAVGRAVAHYTRIG